MRELHTVHKKNGSVMYFGRCACGCKTHPYMSPERAIDAWNAKFDKAKSKEGEINLAMREGRHEVSGKQETSAAIIAEMRDLAEHRDWNNHARQSNRERISDIADRLEAAIKREVDKLNSAIQATVGRSDAEIDRLRREIAEMRQTGDAAKLREAIEAVLLAFNYGESMIVNQLPFSKLLPMLRKCAEALAAPPRNCDRLSADQCKRIFKSEMEIYLPQEATDRDRDIARCTAYGVIDALFAQYTEQKGETDGSK